jgi:light-harvesting complex II chlorophyll a/b binding protein 7
MALCILQAVPSAAVAPRARPARARVAVRAVARPRVAFPRGRWRDARGARVRSSGDVDDASSSSDDAPPDASAAPSSPDSSPLGDLISSPLFYVTAGIALGVAVVQKFENAALFLSAFPIVGLTVLSKTDFGAELEREVLRKRPKLVAGGARARRGARRGAWRADAVLRENRPLLVKNPPAYLDGELPGDYGFDPLGFASPRPSTSDDATANAPPSASADEVSRTTELHADATKPLDRYVELELLHARWAMLAVVGVVVPELLASFGALPVAEPVWWKVGAAKAAGADLAYLGLGGFVIAGKQGIAIIALCQAVLMGGPEYARFVGIRSLEPVGVYLPGDANYPGGAPFDPFGLAGDATFYEQQRVAEIKHGRLAMVAMAGVFAQALATRTGPVENLRDALALVTEGMSS